MTLPRALTDQERALVRHLIAGRAADFEGQFDGLMVVGRCGCMACPTVFFLPHGEGDRERDVAELIGSDGLGGVSGAVLLEKNGRLSQLEAYSVDGHSPYSLPWPGQRS